MSELVVIENQGQRVLTTQQLAESYGTVEKKIRDNFSNNKSRYVDGKHYFKLEGEALKAFKNETENFGVVGTNTSSIYLWTEKGALLHAKSLNTDKAWEVYDHLVETYFQAKDLQNQVSNLSPQLQLLINMELEQKRMQEQLNNVAHKALKASHEAEEAKSEIQGIREVMTLSHNAWRAETTALINKIAQALGGFEHIRHVREESYKLLDERAGAKLSIRQTNMKRKVLEETGSKSKAEKITKIDVIAADRRLTEVYIAIVKEMAIKYKAA